MRTQSDIIHGFLNGETSGKASHMFIIGDVLYSYGRHFPLAVRRKWGSGIAFLINGDRYSSTTTQHTRSCISTLVPNVQIPFSALAEAGLIRGEDIRWAEPKHFEFDIMSYKEDVTFEVCKTCGRTASWDGGEDGQHQYLHDHDRTVLCGLEDGVTTSDLLKYEHVLGGVVLRQPDPDCIETISHSPRGIRTIYKYWLSAMDPEEKWTASAYFLCELPSPALTVERAFASLKPAEVRKAEQAGQTVKRQGDIYFIETSVQTRDLPGPSRRMAPVWWIGEAEAIDRSTHIATEVRKNGRFYVRGIIRHQPPRFRRPQHAPLKLGESWHRVVKNRAGMSFSAEGRVD